MDISKLALRAISGKITNTIAHRLAFSISPSLSLLILISLITNSNGYKILPNKLSFNDAQTYCERTTLASIHGFADPIKVQAFCNSDDSHYLCWIGGYHDTPNSNGNCIYSWTDGSDWDYIAPRFNSNEYCSSGRPYSCLTTPQGISYIANVLHDCGDSLYGPIGNDS